MHLFGICNRKNILPLFSMVCAVAFFTPDDARSADLKEHVYQVKDKCVGHWTAQNCLAALSGVTMDMAVDYANRLDGARKNKYLEPLKQHCAAATAAQKQDVPAYAMKSALTECVNHVSDTNDQSGVSPDVNLYQFLVAGVLCLSEDPMCAQLEMTINRLNP